MINKTKEYKRMSIRKYKRNLLCRSAGVIALALLISNGASASTESNNDLQKRLEQLEIKVAEQNEMLELQVEELEQNNEDLSTSIDHAMKISGYVDVEYKITDQEGKTDGFRMHHLSLFFTKQVNDNIKFFSEIEFEDAPKFEGADTHEGKIFVEAINFDYLSSQEMNLRVGRFFTPAGIWSEDHYPPFVATQERPKHIRKIFPQLVDGASVYGTFNLANAYFQYNTFFGNGDSKPLNGHNDENSSKAFGFRGNFIFPIADELHLGFTGYQDSTDHANGDADKTALGVHAKLRHGAMTWQAEWANADLNFAENSENYERDGYYLQGAYKVNDWLLGGRYDYYDSKSTGDNDLVRTSAFVNYRINENLVLKAEFHHDAYDKTSKEDVNFIVLSIVGYLGQ